ncbi:MAG: hypothetical protein RIQ52_1003 [Pseudomonadota bacterium]
MSVREILRMGDPRLLRTAQQVPSDMLQTQELQDIIRDMLDTMEAAEGAGLAAPQIGIDLQIVIYGISQNPRYPEAPPIPLTTLINPDITPLDETMVEDWEGCLSVPGLRGRVPRWTRVRCCALDGDGQPLDFVAEGFHARVIQHECDHLQGILYPARIRDFSQFGFIDALPAFQSGSTKKT